MGTSYTEGDCARFVDDMIRAGFEVEHYEGPFGWQGPAVTVDDPDTIVRATDVELQWDKTRGGWIVYPVASDDGLQLYSRYTGSSLVQPRKRQGGAKGSTLSGF